MLPKVQIAFYITGDNLKFDVLTERLALQPTRVRKKEEWPKPSILAGIAEDTWEYRTDKEECQAISAQFDKLRGLLSDKIDAINEMKRQYSLEITITVIVETKVKYMPVMFLSKENINFLSQINAELGFDMYRDF